MVDAESALQSAIDELRLALDSLPEELAPEVREAIEHTQAVLDAVRARSPEGA